MNSSAAVANGAVYISSDDGNLYALHAGTGARLWSIATGNPLYSPPVIVNGAVYIRGGFGGVLGFGQLGITYAYSVEAGLFLRIQPTPTTAHQGDLLTYAFPVWNLGPTNADFEGLNTQVPAGTTFEYLHLRHTRTRNLHHSALSGNGTNRVPRKYQHGSEHDVDSAPDREGDRARRHGDHRECSHHVRHTRSESGQQYCDGEPHRAVTRNGGRHELLDPFR